MQNDFYATRIFFVFARPCPIQNCHKGRGSGTPFTLSPRPGEEWGADDRLDASALSPFIMLSSRRLTRAWRLARDWLTVPVAFVSSFCTGEYPPCFLLKRDRSVKNKQASKNPPSPVPAGVTQEGREKLPVGLESEGGGGPQDVLRNTG